MPELRIIEQALWDRAHARLDDIRQSPRVAKQRESRFWEKRRPRHVLTGLVTCGVCGNAMAAVGKDYLACNHAKRRGTCTNSRSIRRSALEQLILDGLKNHLMAPELVKEFIAAFHDEVKRQQTQDRMAYDHLNKELAEVERKIDRLLDAVAEGLPGASVADKLDGLEKRKSELKVRLSGATPSPVTIHPNLAELYRRKVEALQDSLTEPDARSEAIEIIRSLIDRIILMPAKDGFEIELAGEIANMVELANGPETQNKTATSGKAAARDFRSSVKVVAGAGSNLHLRPEQVKMVAGTGVDHNLRSTPVKMVAGGRTHHNLLFRAAA